MGQLQRMEIDSQLPRSAKSAENLRQDSNDGNNTGLESSRPTPENAMSGSPTILCIDDEPTGLAIRKLLLESQGYQVLTATSGREGLAILARHRMPVVVIDYAMPEMDGAEVAAALKRIDPAVKILLLSAYVNLPEKELRWVDACATKGDHPKTFFAAVQQLLSCPEAP